MITPSRLVPTLLLSLTLASDAACQIVIKPKVAKQGETIEVKICLDPQSPLSFLRQANEAKSFTPVINFNGKEYKSYPISGSTLISAVPTLDNAPDSAQARLYRALIAVPANLKPGNYTVAVTDALETAVKVVSGQFVVQRLSLAKGKDTFVASPGEKEAIEKAKRVASEKKLWEGKFIKPNKGRVSAGFGLRRIVNGKLLTDYFHSGIDFAAALGSPVRACAAGKVLLAQTGWRLHGNTVSIDHGQGVVSFYLHLKKIFVVPGNMVQAGDLLGQVGQTGRANGPHLHFSIYVNQEAANPSVWFSKVFQ